MRRGARLPEIARDRCTGCGRCVAACPPHVLVLEVERWKKFALLQPAQGCSGCGLCVPACPFGAIGMRRPAARPAAR